MRPSPEFRSAPGDLIKCPDLGTFDVSQSAALYSQLSGALAGIAVVALIFVLTNLSGRVPADLGEEDERRSNENHVVMALICAFLGLLVSAVLYAILAAEKGDALILGRASSEELLSGIAFAFSVTTLMYGLLHLIAVSGLTRTAHEARVVVALVLPGLATMFLGFAGQDFAFTEILATGQPIGTDCLDSGFYNRISLWGATVLPITVFAACAVMLALSRTRRWHVETHHFPRAQTALFRNGFPKISLGLTIVAAVWSASWSEREPDSTLSHFAVWAWLALAAAYLTAQGAYLIWGDPGASVVLPRQDNAPALDRDGSRDRGREIHQPALELTLRVHGRRRP